MSHRAASWLAWSLAGLSVVMFAAVIALSALVPSAQAPSDRATVSTVSEALVFLSFLAFPLVGALIASRRPYNPIGWLLLVDGILWMLLNAFESYGTYGVAQPGSLPFPAAIAAQNNWLWVPAVGLLGTYLLLLSSFSQFANLTTSVSYARLVSPQSTVHIPNGGVLEMVDRNKERKPFEIVPIKRVDIYGSVLAQLNALITESGMKPGDRLPPERELVEKLGVSRVSVREALRALESMGKIEIRRNAGSFVMNPNGSAFASQLKATHPVDRAFLDYLVDVRAAVEHKMVELVAKRADADLSAVRAVLERTEAELGESVEQGSLDLRFEAALAREVCNPLLAEMQRSVHQLWVEAWSVCRITPGDWRRFHAEHLAILDALERGDGEAARRLMTEHVDRTVENAAPVRKGAHKR